VQDIVSIGDTLWISTSKGLSMSSDAGLSWENFYQKDPFSTEGIYAIGYDKYNGTVWVSTGHEIDIQGGPTPVGTGLHYTTDNGISWTSIPQPIDSSYDSSLVYGINNGVDLPKVRALPVTVPEQNVTYDIGFTPGTVWITSWASGLRKSTDMGKSWERILLPPDYLNSLKPTDTVKFSLQVQSGKFGPEHYNNLLLFSVISTNDSTIYAGSAGGINKSTDNGISWQKFNHQNQDNPIGGNWVVGFKFNQLTNTLWAVTWPADDPNEYYSISSTNDGGNTWNTFLKGEKVYNFGIKGKDVIAPSDDGPFRSSDGGNSWILPNSIYDKESGISFSLKSFYAAASNANHIWLGSSQGLSEITETGNQMWMGDWKLFVASRPLASETQAYVFPNPFSPNIDQNLIFKYSTGGRAASVTIRIYDFGMNYVRTIIQNAQRNLNGTTDVEPVFWNGKDDGGNIVPNGVYFYSIVLNNDKKMYGKILVVK
jgi:hypothetical protein